MGITLARLRRAAQYLSEPDAGGVTIENLAEFLGVPIAEVSDVFTEIAGLSEEVKLVTREEALAARYVHAAERLTRRCEQVTPRALACELGLDIRQVNDWLRVNKSHAAAMSAVSARIGTTSRSYGEREASGLLSGPDC